MAEFGVQATQMPDAQNTVGRDVVSPVQEQAVTTNIIPAIGNVADILMKKYAANQKADFEAYKQSILSTYAQQQQTLNDGVQSGEIDTRVAGSKSRALFGSMIAGYPVFSEDLHKMYNAFKTGSELGVIEDAVKAEADLLKTRTNSAISNGFPIAPWMDKATKETMLQANETAIRVEKEWKQQTERAAERRAQGTYDQGLEDRERKETSLKAITDLAGSNIDSSSAYLQGLQSEVSQGRMDEKTAGLAITQHFSKIEAAIQAAAGLNPELGSAYRSLFTDLKTLGMKAIDPKTSAETSKAMFDEVMYKAKLVAVTQNPALKATVVANSLLGGNAVVALKSLQPITDYIDQMSRVDASKGEGYVKQAVGNPEVEKDVLNFLESAIKKVNKGGYADNDKATKEAVTSVNNILKQTADLQNDPTIRQDPTRLANLAKFFASPDYGEFMAKGMVNKQAAEAAFQAFDRVYTPAVRQSVQTRLSDWAERAKQSGGGVKGYSLSDAVDIRFSGSGIDFVPIKPKVSLEPFQQKQQEAAIAELNSVKAGINQSIRIGAHMEGTTDYNAYWEANKHLYVPQVYPAPPGTIVNGYKYKGGVYKDPSNWIKVE